MTFHPEEPILRAIKFFQNKPDNGGMGIYHDKESDRMFVNVFLASGVQSKKKFRFNPEFIGNWISRFEDKPIVLFKFNEHFEHPVIQGASKDINDRFQETKSVGRVVHPFDSPDKKGTWRGIGEILVSKVREFLKSLNTDEVPVFTSPQVAYMEEDDFDIRNPEPMHVALTDDPAFPPDISVIKGVCEGDQSGCLTQLQNASASHCEAGDKCYLCFVDALRDIIKSNSDNTSLKIINFSNKQIMNETNDDSNNNKDVNQKQDITAETQKLIESQAKDAVNKLLEEQTKLKDQKPNPEGTFNQAYGKDEKQEESPKAPEFTNEQYLAMRKELDDLKLKERKDEIAKRIPLQMVLDNKTNGVNEKLLNEIVNYWIDVKKSPEQIGEFYENQMKQFQVIAPPVKTGKASNSDNFTDDDIASKITQFEAPDIDNAKNNEKIANASVGEVDAWFMEFSDMMVSPLSKAPEGKGVARRMID